MLCRQESSGMEEEEDNNDVRGQRSGMQGVVFGTGSDHYQKLEK